MSFSSSSFSSSSVLCFFLLLFVLPHFSFVSSADANAKLKKCCLTLTSEKDDKDCVARFCDFDAISQANVLNFMSKCKDKGDTVGHMWDCASSRFDHTHCCRGKGVSDKCMEYCSAQDGVPENYVDYVACVDYFDHIRDCFKAHLENKKEEK
ncbi:hypothetical protein niasHS_013110 [Heterodera schachtii]|uniref:Domain of unknown function DB domain-containing protein n=1 Tax=Heterodera schachtii TaxID=97005 RepID=A0ABD2ICW8_HETSC